MEPNPKKLAAISDEVEELHPLLERLFRKMPDIRHVEYTHSGREMGADFVLEKFDSVLSTTKYIGVIVKTISIKQDTDVDRQIKECRLPRTYHGKEQIRLSEIWVVTSGTISKNAEEKLAFEHGSSNISFIGRDWLTELITQHLPEYWGESGDVRVGEYLAKVRTRTRKSIRNTGSFLLPAGRSTSSRISKSSKTIRIG